MWYHVVKGLAAVVLRLYHRVEVKGLSRVPETGPLLLVGNHVSVLDPFYIGAVFPREIRYMAKEESFRHPVARRFLRWFGAFPVNREKPDIRSIKTAFAHLKGSEVVGIFPQGGRGDGTMEAVKQGAAYIALKTGAPVQPVYIDGTSEALPRGAGWIRPSRVRIRFGAPIAVDGNRGGREEQERLSREILHTLKELSENGSDGIRAG